MTRVEAKARLLRRRASALELVPGTMEEAEKIVVAAGMKLPGAAEALRVEWLNDMVVHHSAGEFGLAARDPSRHFLEWVKVRAGNRYHVTYRSIDAVGRRYGADAASRLIVIWPQEIAWAQRLRLSGNPFTATKAAMFLREAEGSPGKVFERIADVFSEAFMRADYVDHPAHDLSSADIRFGSPPDDFVPLCLRYASRAYDEKLFGIPREKLDALARIAAKDELEERGMDAARHSAAVARAAPMRRMIPVIGAAISSSMTPNDLALCERAFVASLDRGELKVEPGTGNPYASFIAAFADAESRSTLLNSSDAVRNEGEDPDNLAWMVVNLRPSWADTLPATFRESSRNLREAMEEWQLDVAEERREPPIDPISDFGFFLLKP